jgi:hypothetical protein
MKGAHLGAGDEFVAVPKIAGLEMLLPVIGYSAAKTQMILNTTLTVEKLKPMKDTLFFLVF